MGKNRTDYYCQGGTILSLNVWYGRLKLLFSISIQVDGRRSKPVEIECAFVSFCYEIKLEPSGMQ